MTKFNRRPLALWSCFISGVFLTILTFIVQYIVSKLLILFYFLCTQLKPFLYLFF